MGTRPWGDIIQDYSIVNRAILRSGAVTLNVILHVYPHTAKYIFATLTENETALWADHFGCLLCPSAKGREARLFSTHRLKLRAEPSQVCSQESMQTTHALTSVSNVGNNKKKCPCSSCSCSICFSPSSKSTSKIPDPWAVSIKVIVLLKS